jgi:hypothetical protein
MSTGRDACRARACVLTLGSRRFSFPATSTNRSSRSCRRPSTRSPTSCRASPTPHAPWRLRFSSRTTSMTSAATPRPSARRIRSSSACSWRFERERCRIFGGARASILSPRPARPWAGSHRRPSGPSVRARAPSWPSPGARSSASRLSDFCIAPISRGARGGLETRPRRKAAGGAPLAGGERSAAPRRRRARPPLLHPGKAVASAPPP